MVDRFAKTDEEGKLLGVMKQTKDDEGKVIDKRVENPQVIDDIEWSDKDAFMEELNKLNDAEVEVTLEGVPVSKKFYHMQHGREFTIEEYLNSSMEPGMILYLEKIGMLTGLDL